MAHIIIVGNYQELSNKAADIFLQQLKSNPKSVFGLPTGETPLELYNILANAYRKYGYDFSQISTFNLDEYVGVKATHKQSYHFFMYKNLFNHINIKKVNIHIPDGCASDLNRHCLAYENLIQTHPIDLQILGIGRNGHIGFNEPGSPADSITRVVNLSAQTIKDNARFFNSKKDVPQQAITMGIKTIMSAKKIILLASGQNKAEAVYSMIESKISEQCPASLLRNHPNVYIITDNSAASLLHKNKISKYLVSS